MEITDVFLWQWPQAAIWFAIVLNEHQIPDFQHIRIIHIDQLGHTTSTDTIEM